MGDTGGAFLTQKGEKLIEVKKEIAELEQLLQGQGQTSQTTLLFKKRKEMREIDDALELIKKDYKKRMEDCEERRIQFELKQLKMREQVLKFEKFIQENDIKRVRADNKIKSEKKIYDEKCKNISILNNKIKELEVDQKNILNEINKRNCYRIYLEEIVDNYDEYEEINEILSRHDVLVNSNLDLVNHASQLEKSVDATRHKFLLFQTEKQNSLLVSNSLFQQNERILDKILENAIKADEDTFKEEDKVKELSRQSSQVEQSIRNILARCHASMKNPTLPVRDGAVSVMDELQFALDVIQSRMTDLIEISDEYKHNICGDISYTGSLGDLNEKSGTTILTGSTIL